QLQPLLLERRERVRAVCVQRTQHLLTECLELAGLGDRLALAADADDRADAVADDGADEPLGRGTLGPLAGLREASLAEDPLRLGNVAARLDERALALHHAGAGLVAELLDERCGNLLLPGAHALSPPSTPSATATGSAAGSSVSASASGSGSASPAASAGAAAVVGAANSFSLTLERPASMLSAIARTTRLHERIA